MRTLLIAAVVAGCSSSPKPPAPPHAPAGNAVRVDGAFDTASEDVTFTAGGRTIPGTLVAPKAPGSWPAVLLLAGSGPTDRDWNSPLIGTKNGSGKLLATELAKHGAVVLRFDKAGSGKNPGPPLATWTIDTYRDETVAALALLRARPEVRPDRVFVAGHSEGGIHATRLAAVASPPLAGVIYLESASRTMLDTVLTQLEKQLRSPMAMLSERAVDAELDSLRQAFADFLASKPVDPEKASKIPQVQQLVAQLVNPATATLARPLLGFDNAVEAAKLAGPFFVTAGGKDIQIDPELDSRRLDTALRDAHRDVTFHLAPDADHVLKNEPRTLEQIRAALQATQDGYNAEGRVLDDDLVRAVVAWLAERSR